jgi:hypothetical protein
VRLVEVPAAYRGLQCVTTRSRRGDAPEGIELTLSESARIIVARDAKLKKLPEWLSSFAPSGERLVAEEVGKKRKAREYHLLWRDFPAGLVALGANAEGSRQGRSSFMYLVCVSRLDGASGGFSEVPR